MAIVTPGVAPASVLVADKPPAWLRRWARFAHGTGFDDLPPHVVDRTKLVLLDTIGAILAGRQEREIAAASVKLGRRARARRGGSPLVNAFLDGAAGTMLEIDEGNQYARGHPGVHVAPAIFALAGQRRVTGKDAIVAMALGYEIGARIGVASKLRVAMHPHGTWGVVGAALATAKLHRASAARILETINVASSLGLATSRRTMLEGATVRNAYAGVANMLGLMAWDLVASGFTGEADGVGSVYGGVAADDWWPDEMTQDLGVRWEIARNYFKRHAACRYTHGALDALRDIVADAGGRLDPESIDAIHVDTYLWAAQLDHRRPANMLAAKFSLPFALATFVVNGAATLDAFRDAARADAVTRALAARVTVDEDPALTAMLPGLRPARVKVTLHDGRVFLREVMTNRGDAEDPYSGDEVREKFLELASPILGGARAASFAAAFADLETAPSLADVLKLSETP